MSNTLKSLLKRWPSLYHSLQRFYYGSRRLIETYVLGTRIEEWIWQTRHIYKGSNWPRGYCDSINHPHRQLLLEKILANTPLKNVLEIGCNTGPNLYLLAQELPKAKLYGIDINRKAIEIGKQWLGKEKITNILLFIGKADKLELFPDKSVDLVFTDGTMLYVGPDKINKTINEMVRITRKALVFNEWHQEDKEEVCFYYYGHWVHNYRKLFEACSLPKDNIRISRIPGDIYGDKSWKAFGAIIEVRL